MTTKNNGNPFDETADKLLLLAVKADEPGAADALIRRYQPQVGAIAAAYSGSAEDAKDLTQEGLLALLGAAKSFDPEKKVPFGAFVSVCVANRLRSVKRREKTDRSSANGNCVPIDTLEVPGGVEPERVLLSDEGRDRIFLLTETVLSGLEKNAFYKRLQGLSAEETAEALGVSKKSAENACARARAKLKAALAAEPDGKPAE